MQAGFYNKRTITPNSPYCEPIYAALGLISMSPGMFLRLFYLLFIRFQTMTIVDFSYF